MHKLLFSVSEPWSTIMYGGSFRSGSPEMRVCTGLAIHAQAIYAYNLQIFWTVSVVAAESSGQLQPKDTLGDVRQSAYQDFCSTPMLS